jgi:hypothetical protein
MPMGIARMLDHNVYFWVVSGLQHGIPGKLADQDWDDVRVVAGYPNDVEALVLPTVAVVREGHTDRPQQIGKATTIIRTDNYVLSVFATRDGQRDDLAEYLKDVVDLRNKHFLDFNDGFGDLDGQTQLGMIEFSFAGMFPVRDLQSQSRANAHRMDVRFNTEYVYSVL